MGYMNKKSSVEIITITRGRPVLLNRALRSALTQTYTGEISVKVVIDDCRETSAFMEKEYASTPCVSWIYKPRSETEESGPALLAKLRTEALLSSSALYVSFLDDDNEYYPFHIEKLADFMAAKNCDAAFSYLELFNRDGSRFLEHRFPWSRVEQEKVYLEKVAEGIMTPNSNIKRDKYGVSIDTNAWMIRRSSLGETFRIDDRFDHGDWKENLAEDDKMMFWFMENNKKVLPNGVVSVKYYLGGYSNIYDGSVEGTIAWKLSQKD